MFKADLADEEDALAFYSKAATAAREINDIGSRVLFEQIPLEDEKHKVSLELEPDLTEPLEEENYASKYVSVAAAVDE